MRNTAQTDLNFACFIVLSFDQQQWGVKMVELWLYGCKLCKIGLQFDLKFEALYSKQIKYSEIDCNFGYFRDSLKEIKKFSDHCQTLNTILVQQEVLFKKLQDFFDTIKQVIVDNSMIFQRDNEQENNLNYQLKKIMHMIQLQIMDVESTLHYIQKKHTLHQIKEVLSQIYSIFNQTELVFKHCKALFLHTAIKKIMNFFGLIYFMLTDNIENGKISQKQPLFIDTHKKDNSSLDEVKLSQKLIKDGPRTEKNVTFRAQINHRPFGGVYLYNQNYSRHLCPSLDPKQKKIKNEKKTEMTTQEFKQEIMDQLNDNLLSMPHPDETIDIFTFKFKYGREKEVVTFHDELQSIAKFFKDAQNQAFQFLNRTKNQNTKMAYNDTFSDIMNQVKMQKEVKLQQFANKIKKAFRSIKNKTQDKWNQIQHKLVEVKQIKNSMIPPQTHEWTTQTIYNIDEQLKYLSKKIEAAEEKYKLMHEIKSKEVEENTIMQIEMQHELSLKTRESVYLKIALEQNRLMINTLNKRIKAFADNHKKIKQTISVSGHEGIKKLAELVESEDVTSQCATEAEKMSLQTLKKQKKMAKKLVADARKNRSVAGQKYLYSKKFSQQIEGLTGSTKEILQKWGLSQISQQLDIQSVSVDQSHHATNRIIQFSVQKTRKNTIIKSPQQTPNGRSTHSIRSAMEDFRPRKEHLKKHKNNSQFLTLNRPSTYLNYIKDPKNSLHDESLCNQTNSEAQSQDHVQHKEQDIRRIQEMYKRQMAKTKSAIIQRKTAFLHQMNQKALQKSKFKADQNQHKKLSSHRLEHFGSRSGHPQMKVTGISSDSPYNSSSFRLSANFNQMNSIDEKEEDKDLHIQLKVLETKNKQLQQLLDKKKKNAYKMCHKQINLTIDPLTSIRTEQNRKHIKLRSEIQEETYCTDVKTDKKSDIRSIKEKKSFYFKDNKTATQFVTRTVIQSKTNTQKQSAQSFYSRREYNNEKSKTSYFSNEQMCLIANCKKESKDQVYRLNIEKKDLQKLKMLQCQKQNEVQNQTGNLGKKSNHLSSKQSKNYFLIPQKSIIQRVSQNIIDQQQLQKKEAQEQQAKIRQIAVNSKNKQQFKQRIRHIHWQRCGKNCKHLQQYLNNFTKYRDQAKARLKMHVQNLNKSIENQPQLPVVKKK